MSAKTIGVSVFLVCGGMLLGALLTRYAFPETTTHQELIHAMGGNVMPFDISTTQHVFAMTETGGVMQVIEKTAGSADDVAMIQMHLSHESTLFSTGNFVDPMTLHGADMPGLDVLAGGMQQVEVGYTALPNGAQITFVTTNATLVTAIHRWFGAQLSDHGADAVSG